MEVSFLKSAFQIDHYPPADRPEVAFAGRSNVGKSTLINVLVNRKKMARTSSTPGRTQAINFFEVGNDLFFVDLPGYGFARVPLSVKKSWGTMVETYLRERSTLKAVVVIMDIRRDVTDGDRQLLTWLDKYGIGVIPVLTKSDKLSKQKSRARVGQIEKQLISIVSCKPTMFSAKTRVGKDNIWGRIKESINT